MMIKYESNRSRIFRLFIQFFKIRFFFCFLCPFPRKKKRCFLLTVGIGIVMKEGCLWQETTEDWPLKRVDHKDLHQEMHVVKVRSRKF